MEKSNTPSAEVLSRVMNGNQPFALYRHENHLDEVVVVEGEMKHYECLDDIPRVVDMHSNESLHTISAIPFSQIRERGYAVIDDGLPIQCLQVFRMTRVALSDVLYGIPKEQIALRGGIQFDIDDAEYAEMVADVQQNQIGKGEGANFVVPRTAESDINNFDRSKALHIFRSLVENEFGTYMTFVFSDGENYLIGASPERHLAVHKGVVGMTPISGTFRKRGDSIDRQQLIEFLRDPKEQHELFMVLDEELKMMAQMCQKGGMAEGPFLREMRKVIHTEYVLTGKSDLDAMELFRKSMYAPTVTGSPIENACRVICEYDPNDRRYYSSALLFLGRDQDGEEELDSAITIRTLEISKDGHVIAKAGATLVQGSDPLEEARETSAKLAGVLSSLSNERTVAAVPQLPTVFDDEMAAILCERNTDLSQYFFKDLDGVDLSVEELVEKEVTIIASDDDFAYVLRHMISKMGAHVRVVHYEKYELSNDTADLVLVGPGTGDPNNINDPTMHKLRAILRDLQQEERPFVSICLGHQLLSSLLGLEVCRKQHPSQGVAEDIALYSERQRVGFYNTFTALKKHLPDVQLSYDSQSQEVHAIRGERFCSFQFHPESVLSTNGFHILKSELQRLLGNDDHHAYSHT